MPTKSPSRTITRRQDWLGPAIHPGEPLLEDYLKPLGAGQLEAAKQLGASLIDRVAQIDSCRHCHLPSSQSR